MKTFNDLISTNSLEELKEMQATLNAKVETLQEEYDAERKKSNKPTVSRLRKKYTQLAKEHANLSGSITVDFTVPFQLTLGVNAETLEDYLDFENNLSICDLFYITISPEIKGFSEYDAALIQEAIFDPAVSESAALKIIAPDLCEKLEAFVTRVNTFVEDLTKNEVTCFDLAYDDGDN